MPQIFISYRREDSGYVASHITEKLQEHFGKESVFFDVDTIPLGVDFKEHIGNAVGQCDVLLAIIGDKWVGENNRLQNTEDFVRVEIESALERDIPVIPVLVGKAKIPDEHLLPKSLHALRFRNAAEVRAGADLRQHINRLITGIQNIVGTNQALQQPPKKKPLFVRILLAILGFIASWGIGLLVAEYFIGQLNEDRTGNILGFIIWGSGTIISLYFIFRKPRKNKKAATDATP
jgi:hypothetical protein